MGVVTVTVDMGPTTSPDEEDAAALRSKVAGLERLRPVWAHGWSNESVAAQISAGALAEIYFLLGVKNQTEAVEKLRSLL